MTRPRSEQICVEDTPYYHCISRCVRRSFLCGVDHYSGISYEHRRQWVEDRLLFLAEVFAIDVCAYAVMSNHTHVVLHINTAKASGWSDRAVIARWHRLYKGNFLSRRVLAGEPLSQAETKCLKQTIKVWRERLCDISWFMRNLNEAIARQANKEDRCTGRFWEGRFKSQALLTEKALAACLAYVDLNPIRAKMAKSPQTSAHTSIKRRIKSAKNNQQPKALFPFVGNPKESMPVGLPFQLEDYFALIDCTGRIIREDKHGHIALSAQPILRRLGISADEWLASTRYFKIPPSRKEKNKAA